MSYILDALKKSDQERQQNSGPDLQTVQRPQRQNKSKGGAFWFAVSLCLVGIFMTAIVVGYLSTTGWFQSAAPDTVIAQQETATTLQTTDTPATENREQIAEKSIAQIASSEALLPVVEFWELPDPVQQAIPPLTFSFHVYSDNPDRRTIIINKHRVKEGDSVVSGLLLQEITPEGVILQWTRHRFSINVVENW